MIRNKRTFYKLASSGKCGNIPKMWMSVDDYWPYRKLYPYVSVRRLRINKPVFPYTHFKQLKEVVSDIAEGDYIINSIPIGNDDCNCKIQGELSWVNGEWWMYYTHTGGYMRKALLDDGHHVYGWKVLRLLRNYCTPADFDDLVELFDMYTDDGRYPVIEFSVLAGHVGIYQDRNTLIWEIRHY
jgi:hypothetical protein